MLFRSLDLANIGVSMPKTHSKVENFIETNYQTCNVQHSMLDESLNKTHEKGFVINGLNNQ